jgi:hypothetical protein
MGLFETKHISATPTYAKYPSREVDGLAQSKLSPPSSKMYDVQLEPEVIKRLVNYRKLFNIFKVSVDLDVYTHISNPSTAYLLSKALGIDEHFLAYLLDALLRIGLVNASGEVDGSPAYQSTAETNQYLSRESPLYLGKERFQDEEISELLERFITEGPSDDVIRKDY